MTTLASWGKKCCVVFSLCIGTIHSISRHRFYSLLFYIHFLFFISFVPAAFTCTLFLLFFISFHHFTPRFTAVYFHPLFTVFFLPHSIFVNRKLPCQTFPVHFFLSSIHPPHSPLHCKPRYHSTSLHLQTYPPKIFTQSLLTTPAFSLSTIRKRHKITL